MDHGDGPIGKTIEIKAGKRYTFFSAILAFILWGGWAFYINGEFGIHSRVISGITQGMCSFVITYILAYLVASLYTKIPYKESEKNRGS